ncbi:tyrosine-protein kinase CSK-like isoform X4 [Macrobrachium rosenbergii]|uniref:tyrosine-protein kinase CSK-like isoform X4 n=1 Tax=Macrobrachium rosenbergii TaxID=79674 RepID=UPI0034D3DDCC
MTGSHVNVERICDGGVGGKRVVTIGVHDTNMSHTTIRGAWAPDTEVVARYAFAGTSPEDLPFAKMEQLTIVRSTNDPNWVKARNRDGMEGMIPTSYVTESRKEVKLNTMAWFHGKISREEAESLLTPHEDGLFLVRESTNFPGDYTLCVCFSDKVEHYRVIYKDNKLTIDEEEFFDHLTKLVEHYEQDADGLCTQLKRSVPKQGKRQYSVDPVKAFKAAGWSINRHDLRLLDSIGKGEFGDVLLGEWGGQKVAVKRLKDSSRAAQGLLEEASLMTSLKHNNLVNLLGLVFEDNCILLVTEFMSKGSLVDYLRSRGRLHVTKRDQINFACDTCSGMAYLESQKVVHRDLAARNVLISEEGVAKVCDFGLAHEMNLKLDGGKFPIKWTAPEALRHSKFSNKSDMWSFGILLWEIYSFGRVPYPRIPLVDVMKHVEKGYRMEAPDSCPPEVYQLMKEAWDLNCEIRPTFHEACKRLSHLQQLTSE